MHKKISFIIVSYKDAEKLQRCVASLPNTSDSEVIVINNNHDNRGFSKGCNFGAAQASGEYLFFLNPDTLVMPGSVEMIYTYLATHQTLACVAPQLCSEKGVPILSFTRQYRWFTAPIVLSWLHTYLPYNPISLWHFYSFSSLSQPRFLEAASGAALCIRRTIFNEIGGFDEKFFMYWEDYDICRRIINCGQKIYYLPQAKVIHSGGGSSHNKGVLKKYFDDARQVFFSKYFGYKYARLLEWWLSFP